MSKRVLILSGSPRKGGNSDLLCDEFQRGAREAGCQVEKIRVSEKDIRYCTGCGACVDKQDGCVQEDDMGEVLDKMVASDVIVMATPVYFYAMNGQMKTLIDRTCAKYTKIKGKEMYFILTAAVSNKQLLNRTVEEFRGYMDCLDGARERGVVYGTGAWNVGEIKGTDAMEKAYSMGRNL